MQSDVCLPILNAVLSHESAEKRLRGRMEALRRRVNFQILNSTSCISIACPVGLARGVDLECHDE